MPGARGDRIPGEGVDRMKRRVFELYARASLTGAGMGMNLSMIANCLTKQSPSE